VGKVMTKQFDVIIVAVDRWDFVRWNRTMSSLSVLLLEKGRDIDGGNVRRAITAILFILLALQCCLRAGWCRSFSDGKLTLSSRVGGHLKEYIGKERRRH